MAETPQAPATNLDARIRRVYASINAVADPDLAKIRATSRGPGHFRLDFTLPAEELANQAYLAIGNVAKRKNHIVEFAKHHGLDSRSAWAKVKGAIQRAPALQVILDLENAEKHPNDHRKKGYSGKKPRLGRLYRGLSTMPPGIAMAHLAGQPLPSRLPPPRVTVDAPVFDSDGERIGYLVELLEEAVSAWEELLLDLQAPPRT